MTLRTLIFLPVNHYPPCPYLTLLSGHPPACLFYPGFCFADCSSLFLYLISLGFPSCLCTLCSINVSVHTRNPRRRVLRSCNLIQYLSSPLSKWHMQCLLTLVELHTSQIRGGEPRQLHLHFSINSGKKWSWKRDLYRYIHTSERAKRKLLACLSLKKKKKKGRTISSGIISSNGKTTPHLNPQINNNTKTLAQLSQDGVILRYRIIAISVLTKNCRFTLQCQMFQFKFRTLHANKFHTNISSFSATYFPLSWHMYAIMAHIYLSWAIAQLLLSKLSIALFPLHSLLPPLAYFAMQQHGNHSQRC